MPLVPLNEVYAEAHREYYAIGQFNASNLEFAQAVIRTAAELGINKINIDTDLRLAFTASVRQTLTEKPELFDPRKILGPARDDITQIIKHKIQLFGSAGRITASSSHRQKHASLA